MALPRTERNQALLEGDYCPLPRAEHSRGTDWCKNLEIEEKDQPVLGQGALGWDGTGWDGMGDQECQRNKDEWGNAGAQGKPAIPK